MPWTTTHYGYRVAPARPRAPAGGRLDPAAGALVRALCTRALEVHETLRGLGKEGRALGLPSPRGRARWSAASVRGMLTNPASMGQEYRGRMRRRRAGHAARRRIRSGRWSEAGSPAHRRPGNWSRRSRPACGRNTVRRSQPSSSCLNSRLPARPQRTLRCSAPWGAVGYGRPVAWPGRPIAGSARMGVGRRRSPSRPSPDRGVVPGPARPRSSQSWSGTLSAPCCGIRHSLRMPWTTPREAPGFHRRCRPGKKRSAKSGSPWSPSLSDSRRRTWPQGASWRSLSDASGPWKRKYRCERPRAPGELPTWIGKPR